MKPFDISGKITLITGGTREKDLGVDEVLS
jgi:hypothetical protein